MNAFFLDNKENPSHFFGGLSKMDTLCLLLLMNLHSEIKVPEEKKKYGEKATSC
jgi:hypothetical protein